MHCFIIRKEIQCLPTRMISVLKLKNAYLGMLLGTEGRYQDYLDSLKQSGALI